MKRALVYLLLHCTVTVAVAQEREIKVLIVYHSVLGHTAALAESVAAGANTVSGAVAILETTESVEIRQVLEADAIIVGSPVQNANVSPPVQRFINSWPIDKADLKDKVGAAFATGGGISAGEEAVQVSILRSLLIFGMVVVGGPEWTSPFGASAVTEEPPFEPREGAPLVQEMFLRKGRQLGRRVAEITVRLTPNQTSPDNQRSN